MAPASVPLTEATAAAVAPAPTAVKTSSSSAVRRTRLSMNARSGTAISSGTAPAGSIATSGISIRSI